MFVTAHEGFAVQAFDLKAVDDVLKPVRAERLAEAVRRAAQLQDTALRQHPSTSPTRAPPIRRNRRASPCSPARRGHHHVEAHGDYARLHTAQVAHPSASPLSTWRKRWRRRPASSAPPTPSRRPAPHRRTPPDAGAANVLVDSVELQVSRLHTLRTARSADAPDHELRGKRRAQDPTERRVVVTGVPRRTRRTSGYDRPRTEIDETTLGHTYVRSLISQLRAALVVFAVLVLLVGPLPRSSPRCRTARACSRPCWLLRRPRPGLLARWYVRRAERNEKDFVRLVEDR